MAIEKGEFYDSLGLKKEEVTKISNFLKKQVLKTLNKFPFTPDGTDSLPILNLEFPNSVHFFGVRGPVLASTVENIMDGVLVSMAKFEGKYQNGPIKREIETPQGLTSKMHVEEIRQFPIQADKGRTYILTKSVDSIGFVRKGRLIKHNKLSVNYSASLQEDI